jgi:glycerol-3-phosphate acyltransferase PlsY
MLNILLGIITAYLIGSIPTSYLMGRARGIDVRKVGSGNVGATNVLRAVGKQEAMITLIGDILKGVISVTLVAAIFGKDIPVGYNAFRVLLGLAVVAGHNWSAFLSFRGGKGVATTCGVLGVLLPVPTAIAIGVFIISLIVTKYVSLSSILLSITVPIMAALSGSEIEFISLAVTLCILISYRHKANIKRLMMGTENKIGQENRPSQ